MAADLAAARAFLPTLKDALDAVPSYSFERRLEQEEARNLALNNLRLVIDGAGGHSENRWDGARVRIHGLRATSTSGLESACRNWLTQVTLKSAQAAMAGAA